MAAKTTKAKERTAKGPSASVKLPNPNKMKVAELRAELTSRGLDTSGTKQTLVDRLLEDRALDKPNAESLAEKQAHDEGDAILEAQMKAAGLKYHPANESNRLIRYQGDCMFDDLGAWAHLGYFGGEPGDIALFHGELRIRTSRMVRHHVVAKIAEDPQIEKEFSRFLEPGKTLKQIAVDLLHEATDVGWSCFPLPDAFRLIFPVPFEEYTPVSRAPRCIPEQAQMPPNVYPPLRFGHVWSRTHYVPLVKADDKEEQTEHALRLKNAPQIAWQPLPPWLQEEFQNITTERKRAKAKASLKEKEKERAVENGSAAASAPLSSSAKPKQMQHAKPRSDAAKDSVSDLPPAAVDTRKSAALTPTETLPYIPSSSSSIGSPPSASTDAQLADASTKKSRKRVASDLPEQLGNSEKRLKESAATGIETQTHEEKERKKENGRERSGGAVTGAGVTNEATGRQWSCARCTYVNAPSLSKCEMCEQLRSGPDGIVAGETAARASKKKRERSETESDQRPKSNKKAKPRRTFLFRTGITRADQELCAVCYEKGRFTVRWMTPPPDAISPKQIDVSGVVFTERKRVDSDTGLAQYVGTGGWENPEDKVFIQFLRGELQWDANGHLVKGSSNEYDEATD